METAFIGLVGVFLGAVLGPLANHWGERFRSKREWKRESYMRQLDELYGPLYLKMCIIPDQDPEYNFFDWDKSEFTKWLREALELIVPRIHLVTNDLAAKICHYREIASSDGYDAEPATRELYRHVCKEFFSLRRRLYIY